MDAPDAPRAAGGPVFRPGRLILSAIAVFALGSLGLASLEAWRLLRHANDSIHAVGGVDYLADSAVQQYIDLLLESGFDQPKLDPDEPLLGLRTIVVAEAMNERVARGVVERLIYLDSLDSEEPIELRLATSGGWLDSAFMIIDAMRAIDAPVNATAVGGCYSAGAVVLAAATGRRAATPGTLLSVHVNDYRPAGDYDLDRHDLLRMRRVFGAYTDIPQEWFDAPGDNHYYLDADQALEFQLIDEIAPPKWEEPQREDRDALPRAA